MPYPFTRLPFLRSRSWEPIRTMDEWRDRRKAVNEGFVEAKSAWEIGNAWVSGGVPSVPDEFQALLDSHEQTRGTSVHWGIVEHKTPLRFPSGPRNHDLALCCYRNRKRVVIGIEAKANDGLAGTLKKDLLAAFKKHGKNERTNKDARVDWLTRALLGFASPLAAGPTGTESYEQLLHDGILSLPYQLFAGVAGTLLEAKAHRASGAIFAVHQFRTRLTDDYKIEADERLLDSFVHKLVERNRSTVLQVSASVPLRWGKLIGPIFLDERDCGESRWNMPTTIPLFVGKVLTNRLV